MVIFFTLAARVSFCTILQGLAAYVTTLRYGNKYVHQRFPFSFRRRNDALVTDWLKRFIRMMTANHLTADQGWKIGSRKT